MAKFKNDKGLTLIELLITIAVLAVVSAIALPVINNVVSSSNSNAAAQTQGDVTDFITKYNAAGEVLFSASTTGTVLSGYVDTDGDNTIDSNELVDTLTIDTTKFSISAAGTSDNVGGTYTSKGISGATVSLASNGGTTTGTSVASGLLSVSYDWSASTWRLNESSYNAQSMGVLTGVQAGDTVIVTATTVNAGADINISGTYTVVSVYTDSNGYPALELDSSFNSAFQGSAGYWASSWYAGVSVQINR